MVGRLGIGSGDRRAKSILLEQLQKDSNQLTVTNEDDKNVKEQISNILI